MTGDKRILLTKEEIKKLRTAETVVSTAIHPDTNKFIPWTVRCSSFVVMNLPIGFGFIVAAPTPFNTIFWQWVNQTYNAAFNYGNRNATSLYSTEDILKSYFAAVFSSIAVALSIRKALEGTTKGLKGPKLIFYNSISSFFACSTAGFLNAWLMRRTELERGIDVCDKDGKSYGKSKVAAKKAVTQTAISRYILAVPIFIPSICLFSIEKMGFLPRNFYMRTFLELFFIASELYLAVPLGIALYP